MSDVPSFRAAYARYVLNSHLREKYNSLPNNVNVSKLPQKPLEDRPNFQGSEPSNDINNVRVCIVGAGAAGLAVAIKLHIAGFTNVTILEASDRHGGRCYSYPFQSGDSCPHNYYDVGAMRIPKIQTMQSTFNMVDYLNDPKQGLQPEDQVKLVEYIYNAHCEPTMYFYQPSAPDNQRFEDFMFKPGEGILPMNNFVDPTTLQPTTDFDAAFEAYMQSTDRPDNYSTRGFLTSKGWAFNDIELAETLDTSTGLFDQAFMETICDYYDFKAAAITNADWYRVEGGMSNLTDAMYKVATNQGAGVTLNTSVTNMSRNGGKVDVTSLNTQNGTSSTDSYDAVFNTTTFGALQRMDLSGLDLNQNQLIGIRALSYDRATKVAIKFSQPWWKAIMPEPAPHDPPYPNYTFGGVSSTDLPVSNVVYPSWDDGDDTAHTIIVSYSWAQDATRMASLVADQNVEKQDKSDPLIQLIFANLAKLWASVPGAENLMSTLNTTYQTHHAFAWSHDPHATGGFALFGPGQFSNMYEQFTKPLCGGKVMICGEAVSAHHAWISGALDSAYNAVITWLECNENTQGQVALKNSAVGGGQGEHPAEVDETLVYWNAKLRDVHLGEEVSRSDSKVLGK